MENERDFALLMLRIYHDAAGVKMKEAEEAALRASALREEAVAMLDRATHLATEYAKIKRVHDENPTISDDHDEIDF